MARHEQKEHSVEFKKFKQVSQEDQSLISSIRDHIDLSRVGTILDVGGREGYISAQFGHGKDITIVDSDSQIICEKEDVAFIQKQIQSCLLDKTYDLIIASHIWGILHKEGVGKNVFEKLYDSLNKEGTLVLCYNTNTGFMGELLSFAKKRLPNLNYDYFNETLLENQKDIVTDTFTSLLTYNSFEELGRCCWLLFATENEDEETVGKVFEPFLRRHLDTPQFDLEQKVVFIKKHA